MRERLARPRERLQRALSRGSFIEKPTDVDDEGRAIVSRVQVLSSIYYCGCPQLAKRNLCWHLLKGNPLTFKASCVHSFQTTGFIIVAAQGKVLLIAVSKGDPASLASGGAQSNSPVRLKLHWAFVITNPPIDYWALKEDLIEFTGPKRPPFILIKSQGRLLRHTFLVAAREVDANETHLINNRRQWRLANEVVAGR